MCLNKNNNSAETTYDCNLYEESAIMYAEGNVNDECNSAYKHSSYDNIIGKNINDSIASVRNTRKKKRKHKGRSKTLYDPINSEGFIHQHNLPLHHDSYVGKYTSKNESVINDFHSVTNQKNKRKDEHENQKAENGSDQHCYDDCIIECYTTPTGNGKFGSNRKNRIKCMDKSINEQFITGNESTLFSNNNAKNNCESIVTENYFKKKKHKNRSLNMCDFENGSISVYQHNLSTDQDSYTGKCAVENITPSKTKYRLQEGEARKNDFASNVFKSPKKKKKAANVSEQSFDTECIYKKKSANTENDYNQGKENITMYVSKNIEQNVNDPIVSDRNFRKKKHKHEKISDDLCTLVNKDGSVYRCDSSLQEDSYKRKYTVENITEGVYDKSCINTNDFLPVTDQKTQKLKYKKQKSDVCEPKFDDDGLIEYYTTSTGQDTFSQSRESCIIGHKHTSDNNDNAENNYESIFLKRHCKSKKHKNVNFDMCTFDNRNASLYQHNLSRDQDMGKCTVENVIHSSIEEISPENSNFTCNVFQSPRRKKKNDINASEQNDNECTDKTISSTKTKLKCNESKESMVHLDASINGKDIRGHGNNFVSQRNFRKKKYKYKKISDGLCTRLNNEEPVYQRDLSLHPDSYTSENIAEEAYEETDILPVRYHKIKKKGKQEKQEAKDFDEQNFGSKYTTESNRISVGSYNLNQNTESHENCAEDDMRGRYTVGDNQMSDINAKGNNCESIISKKKIRKKKHKNIDIGTFENEGSSVYQHGFLLDKDSYEETYIVKNVTDSNVAKDRFEKDDTTENTTIVLQSNPKEREKNWRKIMNVSENHFSNEWFQNNNNSAETQYDCNQTKESKKKHKHKNIDFQMGTFESDDTSVYQHCLSLDSYEGTCAQENVTDSNNAKDIFHRTDTTEREKKKKGEKIRNVSGIHLNRECFQNNSEIQYGCNLTKKKSKKKHKNIDCNMGTVESDSATVYQHNLSLDQDTNEKTYMVQNITNGNIARDIFEKYDPTEREKKTGEKIRNVSGVHFNKECFQNNSETQYGCNQTKKKSKRKHKNIDCDMGTFESDSATVYQHNLSLDQDTNEKTCMVQNIADGNIARDIFEKYDPTEREKKKGEKIRNVSGVHFNKECFQNNSEIQYGCNQTRKKSKKKHKNIDFDMGTFESDSATVYQHNLSLDQDTNEKTYMVQNITNGNITRDIFEKYDPTENASIVLQSSLGEEKEQKIRNIIEEHFNIECIQINSNSSGTQNDCNMHKESGNLTGIYITGQEHCSGNNSIDKNNSNTVISKINFKKNKHKHSSEDLFEKYIDINDNASYINQSDQRESIYKKQDVRMKNVESDLKKPSAKFVSAIHIQKPLEMCLQDKVLDFTEDPVDFEIPLLHLSETVSPVTENQKQCLISEGISIKTGKFTAVEDDTILKNFNEFIEKYGVSDPLELFGIGRYKKDYDILKFIKAKHFYVRLGKDLNNRTLHSIYKRARLILNPSRNARKVDVDDIKAIKQLHTQIGSKWTLIGDTLCKSGEACMQVHRWHNDSMSKGKWTVEEEKSLIDAIKKVSGKSDISCDSIQSISWNEVAAHVPTRNFSQCRWYWANHLAWKENSVKQKWDKTCSRKLIDILNKDWNVEDVSMIDWKKIHECFEHVAPSPAFLHKRFLYLKSQIPGHKSMGYKDIIKKLCIKYHLVSCDR